MVKVNCNYKVDEVSFPREGWPSTVAMESKCLELNGTNTWMHNRAFRELASVSAFLGRSPYRSNFKATVNIPSVWYHFNCRHSRNSSSLSMDVERATFRLLGGNPLVMRYQSFRKGCRARRVAARPNEIDESGSNSRARRLRSTKGAEDHPGQLSEIFLRC